MSDLPTFWLTNETGDGRKFTVATLEDALAKAGPGWRLAGPYEKLNGCCNAPRPKAAGICCRQWAGARTKHVGVGSCSFHRGNTEEHRKHARKITIEADAIRFGVPRTIDAEQGMLEELHRTAGIVDFLHRRLVAMDPADFVWGEYEHRAGYGPEGPVDVRTHRADLVVEVKWYREERRHLAEVAATCLKNNIEERRVRIAENQAALMATALRGIFADLGVSDHPDLPAIVRRHLMALRPPDELDAA